MNNIQTFPVAAAACILLLSSGAPAWAATGIQIGASGKTYASSGVQCTLHPSRGMAPVVQAGLYNPRPKTRAVVSDNSVPVATVTFYAPDANVWLANGLNTVDVSINSRTADSYAFDASLSYLNQPNMCIPDTSGNVRSGDLEYSATMKSYATVTSGCAFNPLTGRAQPFVNLFDNGTYLLNISVNNVPLTQLSTLNTHTPVFLSAGLNVITAENATLSTDYFVRDGKSGTCTLP